MPVSAPVVNPLQDFYETPGVPLCSGADRARRQALMLARVLRDVAGPAVVLDVGCGDGSALAVMAGQNPGHRFAGIDWSSGALRSAQALGLTVLRGGVTPGLPVADGTADVVIMSELIEHLVDPDGAVAEVRRVLRPGGSLLLSTPNLAAWYNRGLLTLGVQPIFSEVSLRGVFGRPGSVVAGHLRLYTRRALTGFLSASGFRCVTVAGARYHDVPRPLRPLDQAFCRWPSAASILLVHARKELDRRWRRRPGPGPQAGTRPPPASARPAPAGARPPRASVRSRAGAPASRSRSAAWSSGSSPGWSCHSPC
jgi:SAM-dependent methyltransferase